MYQVFIQRTNQQQNLEDRHGMAYQLRQGQRINYCELVDTKLPQAKRTGRQQDEKLYAIEELEEKDGQVKIHYTGYSSDYDEWRNKDIVLPTEPERYHPYDHHQQLIDAIKTSLYLCRDRDPAV